MLNDISIEKERYVSKSKIILMREHVLKPHRIISRSKLPAINDMVRKLAKSRK